MPSAWRKNAQQKNASIIYNEKQSSTTHMQVSQWCLVVIWTLAVCNLFYGYLVESPRPSGADFGSTPKYLWTYLLATAALCFVLNSFVVFRIALSEHFDKYDHLVTSLGVLLYYGLQTQFFPLVRKTLHATDNVLHRRHKRTLLALLYACVLPNIAILIVCLKTRLLLGLQAFCVAHVLLNDALLYGSLFAVLTASE